MALPNSPNAISIGDIAAEFGGAAPHALSAEYAAYVSKSPSTTISISDFYGLSNAPTVVSWSQVAAWSSTSGGNTVGNIPVALQSGDVLVAMGGVGLLVQTSGEQFQFRASSSDFFTDFDNTTICSGSGDKALVGYHVVTSTIAANTAQVGIQTNSANAKAVFILVVRGGGFTPTVVGSDNNTTGNGNVTLSVAATGAKVIAVATFDDFTRTALFGDSTLEANKLSVTTTSTTSDTITGSYKLISGLTTFSSTVNNLTDEKVMASIG